MDWSALAHLFAAITELPAVVLGPTGKVKLIAPSVEKALGWSIEDVGALWLERCVPPAAATQAARQLELARNGALSSMQLPIRTARGSGFANFDVRPFGRAEDAGVLLLLRSHVMQSIHPPATDYDYEVRGVSTGRPILKRLLRPGLDDTAPSGTCFDVLHGRTSPCAHCPLRQVSGVERRASVQIEPARQCTVTTITCEGHDTAHLSVRHVDMEAIAAITQARLDALADRAGLSPRERAVFTRMIDGTSMEDIASELAISPRTVKFHQANVLQKLGADSRSDLLRLVV